MAAAGVALVLAIAPGAPVARCVVPGMPKTVGQLWRPDITAATAYARRTGDIALGVRTAGRFSGYRSDRQEWSASVAKAMLLVSDLDRPSVRTRALTGDEKAVLGPMIRIADNDDAQRISDTVGQAGLTGLARRVGMTHFATNPVWGETLITPRDQTQFFLSIDAFTAPRHRSYAMRLLRSVTRLNGAGSRNSRPPAGSCTSRAAGATARAWRTTRSRRSSAAARASHSPCSRTPTARTATARRR